MTRFTLGVHHLPAAEVVLIKTLIRLFAHDPQFRWRFADTGPFDVVLTDAAGAAPAPPPQLARTVLKITRASAAGHDDSHSISRPIRAEQLQAWLEQQEPWLRTLPRPSAAAPKRVMGESGGFKLRRWPSAALLNNDPQRIRLATLLARRPLGARELSRISQVPVAQCQAFVDTLSEAGLLEAAAAAQPRPAPRTAFAQDLISGIRRRLGL